MAIPRETYELLRRLSGYACEYCGVSETDAGGELTVDHYQPRSRGGTDELGNLVIWPKLTPMNPHELNCSLVNGIFSSNF